MTLATSAVALVYDNAQFGPVSPVQGQRYRLELSPTVGTINYTGVLIDYRRYVMPAPFYTIAARVVHYGRYGNDGDDTRLYPIHVDDPGFVRGFQSGEVIAVCAPSSTGACTPTSPRAGSRILAGNLELRFPLLRPFGVSRMMYGPVPVEAVLFADSGVASRQGHPRFDDADEKDQSQDADGEGLKRLFAPQSHQAAQGSRRQSRGCHDQDGLANLFRRHATE